MTDVDRQIAELIHEHEAIDWRAVPGVGVQEAGLWTRRLARARERLDSEEINV